MRGFLQKLSLTGVAAVLASSALAADKLTMQMNWTADSAHLGFAVAQAEGFYEKHNLEVELIEGRGSAVAAQLVATGQVPLGYADTGAVLKVASQGAPIKIISTIWKSGQFGIQYLNESGISEPSDLIGKKIAVSPGSAMMPLVPVFLKANGIALSDVEIVNATEAAFLGLLTSGDVDAVSQTPENIVVPLAAKGIDAGNMYFYNNGVPIASLSLVANEQMLEEKGDVYRRFIQATAEGWQQAMADPGAAIDYLLDIFPDTENTKETLMQAAVFSFTSVCPGGSGDSIGATSADTWDAMFEVMTSAMGLPEENPVTTYYSNDYLPSDPVTCP